MVVTASRVAVYILELRSKAALPEWKSRPSANAPKMLEMEEPMTLPKARAGRFWLTAATTTASWRQLSALRSQCSIHLQLTSSHSAPAVSRAINAGDTPSLLATTTVWSTKRSAPHSKRNNDAIEAHTLKAKLSHSIFGRLCYRGICQS